MLNRLNNFPKGAVASVIGAVSAYLAAKGYIGTEETILIWAISTIIFGAASYEGRIAAMKLQQSTQI